MTRKKKQGAEAASQDNRTAVVDHNVAPPESATSGASPTGETPDTPQGEQLGETQRGSFRS